jgi:tRNA dimethylallyltransferase
MGALGYRQLRAHLRGELDLDEAVRQTKRDTWRFAKRQLNWFRGEREIRWFERASAVTPEIFAAC